MCECIQHEWEICGSRDYGLVVCCSECGKLGIVEDNGEHMGQPYTRGGKVEECIDEVGRGCWCYARRKLDYSTIERCSD